MTSAQTARHAHNRLAKEASPYLLQHSANPVDWYPWGQEALQAAKEADKPILLSIGYAACHWCHVMAHESFENEATADAMNEAFICVKVDREERPDIDHIYMSALQAMGQQGGWPLTMFLTPDGRPFWGGTYFPPEPRYGRPSFRQILTAIGDAWKNRREAIEQNLQQLTRALEKLSEATAGPEVTGELLNAVDAALLRNLDMDKGGFVGAPKFPNVPVFRFFWQEYHRTGRQELAAAVHSLLNHMARGGIYDHLGGGFARYSTDADWLVPHFEKMAYDNGQILELLALAYLDSRQPLYARCIEETIGWLTRDMAVPVVAGRHSQAFAASEDADSEGEEGRFYVWSEAEIDVLLGSEASGFKQAYGVAPAGNWEGKTILHRPETGKETDADDWRSARDILFQARENRIRPAKDDKVLADWNGLVVVGIVKAAIALGRPEWLHRAEEAYEAVRQALLLTDGRIAHAWRAGRITAAGLLDDQASTIRAALALYEATGKPRYLSEAVAQARVTRTYFADGAGGYFTTASDASDVPLTRPRIFADHATPSGNGMMADALARLYHLTGDDEWRAEASSLIQGLTGSPQALATAPYLLAAADVLERGIVVTLHGETDDPETEHLVQTALTVSDPAIVVSRVQSHPFIQAVAADPKALRDEEAAKRSRPYALVCHWQACSLPLHTVEMLRAALNRKEA